jgi:hypothetical protein
MVNQDRDKLNAIGRIHLEIFHAAIVPTRKSSERLSWEHQMFIYFAMKNKSFNVADFLFDDLCKNIVESLRERNPVIRHPRLLSELFYKSGIVECLSKTISPLIQVIYPPSKLSLYFLEKCGFVK